MNAEYSQSEIVTSNRDVRVPITISSKLPTIDLSRTYAASHNTVSCTGIMNHCLVLNTLKIFKLKTMANRPARAVWAMK